jgi:hypothetical protein
VTGVQTCALPISEMVCERPASRRHPRRCASLGGRLGNSGVVPADPCNARDPHRDRPFSAASAEWGAQDAQNTELGAAPALRRLAPLTCSFLPRSRAAQAVRMRDVSATTQRSRDSRLGLDQLRRRSGRFPGQPTTHIPADLDRNRKGAPSPPRSNGQAFDEARNPVTVAGRRCRASGRVRPRWDQAFPCCSPLTGWALRPLAASRPSRLAAALSYLTEGGRVRLGSVDWQ